MENKTVPFVAFESALIRLERTIKRLWILLIVVLALFVGSNVLWIYYENQFTDIMTTTEQEISQEADNGGNNYAVGGDYVEAGN